MTWGDPKENAELLRAADLPAAFDCAHCTRHVDLALLVALLGDVIDDRDATLFARTQDGGYVCAECYEDRYPDERGQE